MDSVYEYIFINEFDMNIYNNGPVSDNDFLSKLQEQVNLISNVLSYNSGIPMFTTFINHNNNNYKITVKRA